MVAQFREEDFKDAMLKVPIPLGGLLQKVYENRKHFKQGLTLINVASTPAGHQSRIWLRPQRNSEHFSFAFRESDEYAKNADLDYLDDWNAVGVKITSSGKDITVLYRPKNRGR